MMIKILFFVLAVFSYACSSGSDKSFGENFKPFNKNQILHFKHVCSEMGNERPNNLQSYAFFESTNPKALALGRVNLGLVLDIRSGKQRRGVSFDPTKMRIATLTSWAGDSFSITLQMKNIKTSEIATGVGLKTFSYSDHIIKYPVKRSYKVSNTGQFMWIDFTEPENNKKTRSKAFRFSENIYVFIDSLKNLENEHKLYLILENLKSRKQIRLEGPRLKTILNVSKDSGRKGGLLNWFSDSRRYGKCSQLRKASKKQFDIKFNTL